MKSGWYKLASIVVLLAGLIWVLGNLYFNGIAEFMSSNINYGVIFVEGILGSLLFFIIFFFPGVTYFKLKKYNKLTNASVILILIAAIFIVISIVLVLMIFFSGSGGFALLVPAYLGLFPAGILYALAVLLLIINWFKNRNN